MQAGTDVVPRKDLIGSAVAGDVPLDGETVLGHGLFPEGQVEVLAPLLEHTAPPPHLLDDGADAPVAARSDPLDQGGLGVVPAQLYGAVAPQVVAQERNLALELGHAVLPEPLERRVGLGDESAERRRHRRALRVAAADGDAVPCEPSDAERVVVHLRRKPGHEVQLHPSPSLRVRSLHGTVEVFLADELVDHLAQTPGPCLGRKGETRAPHLLDLGGHPDGEGVDTQAGK